VGKTGWRLNMKLLFAIFMVIVFSSTTFAQDEEITLTTYYPAPYGTYNFLSVGDDTNTPHADTELYISDSTGPATLQLYGAPDAGIPLNYSCIFLDSVEATAKRWMVSHRAKVGQENKLGFWYTPDKSDVTAWSHVMSLGTDGKIGVGTTAPFGKFHVAGGQISAEDGIYVSGTGGNNQIAWRTDMTAAGIQSNAIKMDSVAPYDMQFYTGGVEHMRLDATGNVGIGTATPKGRMHLYNPSASSILQIECDKANNAAQSSINLITHGDGQSYLEQASTKGWHITARGDSWAGANEQNDFSIWYWDGAGWDQALHIDSADSKVYGNLNTPLPFPLPDYVFEPPYKLESIEDHAQFMWENKHLPAIERLEKTEDGTYVINVGADRNQLLEELEKAHIYIEQLHKRVKVLEEKFSKEGA